MFILEEGYMFQTVESGRPDRDTMHNGWQGRPGELYSVLSEAKVINLVGWQLTWQSAVESYVVVKSKMPMSTEYDSTQVLDESDSLKDYPNNFQKKNTSPERLSRYLKSVWCKNKQMHLSKWKSVSVFWSSLCLLWYFFRLHCVSFRQQMLISWKLGWNDSC